MRKYNINAYLVCTIEHLYENAMNAVQMNGSIGNGSEQQLELGKDIFFHPPLQHFS